MTSDRIQRQVDRLLDRAEEALSRFDWEELRNCAGAALRLDPDNADARAYLAAAQPDGASSPSTASGTGATGVARSPERGEGIGQTPSSFAGGRYSVKRFLGEGGKKRVYLAHDTTLARDVAFALIKTDGLDTEGRERITREAQAMGRLGTHPHVVSVFDMGSEGESPYLVTELMQGGDIEGLLEKAPDHRLAIPDAVSLAVQVCRGLEFAHSHGLVHRDLKPGNVWLTADGTAKIGDFGLAVSLDRSRLTRAGMMVGTVSYMPPEQAMGGEVSPRSDLYSLGAMLYEMVTGRPPFVGEESVAIITQHLNVPPVSPTWHRPDCPPGLEALILRLLEKDAAKRPASAAEVRQMLEHLAVQDPTSKAQADGGGDLGPGTLDLGLRSDNPLYRRTFVGREQELRQLQATFDGAVSGNGALMMVVGEPGIGKTALCEQLATYVTVRGGKALVGHCYEEGSLSLPYLPFVEAIRSHVLEREPAALKTELGSGATDVARIVSEVRDKVQIEPRSSGDPEDDRWRLYQSLTGFLRNASAVQPLLIILEDLHWADQGSLDLLLHLGRNLSGARLLIVSTYRDVDVDRAHPLSGTLAELRRLENFGRVSLRGLTGDEVHRMLKDLTSQDVRWSLAEAVHRQTEGNPLFVQEVLRYLVEEGIISRQDGRYHRTGDEAPEMRIPEGLRDVIGKRLSRLSAECNRVLSIAAVIGRDFRLSTLNQVSGLDEETVVRALEEAVRVGVLEERTRPGEILYRFAHAFFRQTLYEEMLAPRRLRLHQEVGRALETDYGARVGDHAAELAEHFAQSTDRADLEKAVHWSRVAATRAMAVYAYGEAGRLLEQALGVQEVVDPDDKRTRCELLLLLGEALGPAGEPLRAADEVAEEAFLLAESLNDGALAGASCEIAFSGLTRYGGPPTIAGSLGARWTQRADTWALPNTRARVWADAVGFVVGARDGRDVIDLFRRAWNGARRLGDAEARFSCGIQLLANSFLGYWQEQAAVARELAEAPRAGAGAMTVATALEPCAAFLLAFGERDRAEALWLETAALAAKHPDSGLMGRAVLGEMNRGLLDGKLEAVLEAGARAIALGEAAGTLRGLHEDGRRGFIARRHLGRFAAAVDRLQPLLGGRQDVTSDRNIRAALALGLASLGQAEEAAQIIRELTSEWGPQGPPPHCGLAELTSIIETAVLLRQTDTVVTVSRALTTAASIINTRGRDLSCIGRVLGDAALFLGNPEAARSYYEQGLEVCRRARFRPEVALCRLGLAEALLSEGNQAAAQEHLDFAIAEFQAMKMQPALERALKHKGLLHA